MEIVRTSKREKLSFDGMIQHFKDKNIKFNYITEEEAKTYLAESNYFFKISSYRKNFDKNGKGKYLALDFKMLSDLATIDMRLRYIVIHMSLDIEHAIKTKIHKDITNNENEDGYSIVDDFFIKSGLSKNEILKPMTSDSHYNFGLYNTYSKHTPVWVLFEILSFGQFVRFVEFYYIRSGKSRDYADINRVLRYVKNIRNSAAHNNTLIMDIVRKTQKPFQPDFFITDFVSNVPNISKELRRKRLKNRKVHDLTALLAVHYKFIQSVHMKQVRYEDLDYLLKRAKREQDMYKENAALISVYEYFKNIVDFLNSNLYNYH